MRCGFAVTAVLLASCAPRASRTESRDGASVAAEPAAESAQAVDAVGARPFAPGIRVDRSMHQVIVDGTVVLTRGFLEQLVCTPSTRVHESLVAIDAAPRELHAALLLAGLEPGAPGRWQEVPDGRGGWTVDRVRPTGPEVDVSVRWASPDGAVREVPILEWVRRVDASGDPAATVHGGVSPSGQLVFSGSRIRTNTPSMGAGEHYVADLTGSVVGLVTFGDEVIAYDEVIADRIEVDPAAWVACTERMPPEGTRVELLIRPHRSGR